METDNGIVVWISRRGLGGHDNLRFRRVAPVGLCTTTRAVACPVPDGKVTADGRSSNSGLASAGKAGLPGPRANITRARHRTPPRMKPPATASCDGRWQPITAKRLPISGACLRIRISERCPMALAKLRIVARRVAAVKESAAIPTKDPRGVWHTGTGRVQGRFSSAFLLRAESFSSCVHCPLRSRY